MSESVRASIESQLPAKILMGKAYPIVLTKNDNPCPVFVRIDSISRMGKNCAIHIISLENLPTFGWSLVFTRLQSNNVLANDGYSPISRTDARKWLEAHKVN